MEVHPPRNLGLDLVRVTEAAALSAGRWMGRGQKEAADHAAIEAMVRSLNAVDMDGHVVVGEEGRLGEHSPLDSGQRVGTGNGPQVDLVLNPIDGAGLVARGHPGAISVAGVASPSSMWSPTPAVYMDKIVVGREAAGVLVPECLDAPAAWTVALVARAKQKPVRDLVVFVLDRPRHCDLIDEVRAAGARVLLRSEGDIGGALMAAIPQVDVDILLGIGGVAEGVIAACAVKAIGGGMLGRIAPQSDEEWAAVRAAGLNTEEILSAQEMVSSDEIFFTATGITSGELLPGVRYHGNRAEVHSLIIRSETRTRRFIQAEYEVD
jgi:fructose-1,6-bisphosphatase II